MDTFNIGMMGHVEHGKSTLAKALSSTITMRHSKEIEKNMTMQLGYANAKIHQSVDYSPILWRWNKSTTPDEYTEEIGEQNVKMLCVRKVALLDMPGHNSLMSTAMSGASIIDAAILVISAKDSIQPQTKEHIRALQLMQNKNILIIQNKIDLVSRQEAIDNYEKISEYKKNTILKNAPIIPVCAQLGFGLDAIAEYIMQIPQPKRKFEGPPKMIIVRSFDVNKKGTDNIKDLVGGVIGGTLIEGTLRVGDKVKLSPGLLYKKNNKIYNAIIETRVESISNGDTELDQAYPGGLIGVRLTVDPYLSSKDKLIGNVMTYDTNVPNITNNIVFKINLMAINEEPKLKKKMPIKVTIKSSTIEAIIINQKKDEYYVKLLRPACLSVGESFIIQKKINNYWQIYCRAVATMFLNS